MADETVVADTATDDVTETEEATLGNAATKETEVLAAGAAEGEGEKEADKAAEKATDKATEAPAEAEITLPENAEIDPDVLAALKTGKPQDIADAFIKAQEKGRESYAQQQKQWVEDLRADKEFGGEHFDKNVKLANRAYGKFGSEGLTTLLKETGLGNHPEIIRHFHKLATMDAEDTVAGDGASPDKKPTTEDALRDLYKRSPKLFKE